VGFITFDFLIFENQEIKIFPPTKEAKITFSLFFTFDYEVTSLNLGPFRYLCTN